MVGNVYDHNKVYNALSPLSLARINYWLVVGMMLSGPDDFYTTKMSAFFIYIFKGLKIRREKRECFTLGAADISINGTFSIATVNVQRVTIKPCSDLILGEFSKNKRRFYYVIYGCM